MPPKIRQLKSMLRKAGAYQISQEGSHTKWKHPLVPANVLILSGHDGDDAKLYRKKMFVCCYNRFQQLERKASRE